MQNTLAALAQRMPRVVREHEVLHVAGWMLNENPAAAAKAAITEVLRWAERRCGGRLPPEAWRNESFEYYSGGRNSNGVQLKTEGSEIWAIRADDPDKIVPGRVWTNEVAVGLLPGQQARFSARLLCSTPESNLVIEPHTPGFVQQVVGTCKLVRGDVPLSIEPMSIATDGDAEELFDHLVNPKRELPTFVVTLPSCALSHHPHLNVGTLSRAMLGIAHVAVVHADMTWHLTDRFGKFRSVFGGAVRAYMPGFNESADPYAHRLVLADQINAPGGGERCSHWMRQLAATESIWRAKLGRDVLAFSDIRAVSLQLRQVELESEGASDADQLAAAKQRLATLENDIERQHSEQDYYVEEHDKERQRAEYAEQQAQASAYRIRELTRLLKDKGHDPDQSIPLPGSWQELSDWCDQHLSGRLVLTSTGRRGAKAPVYSEVATVARCLHWLASDCREARSVGGSGSINNKTIMEGILNASCGSDAFDFDWNGRRFSADWHIKNGGNTRDPSRCLRIYYCFDEQTQQIIVADLPAHRRTGAS